MAICVTRADVMLSKQKNRLPQSPNKPPLWLSVRVGQKQKMLTEDDRTQTVSWPATLAQLLPISQSLIHECHAQL